MKLKSLAVLFVELVNGQRSIRSPPNPPPFDGSFTLGNSPFDAPFPSSISFPLTMIDLPGTATSVSPTLTSTTLSTTTTTESTTTTTTVTTTTTTTTTTTIVSTTVSTTFTVVQPPPSTSFVAGPVNADKNQNDNTVMTILLGIVGFVCAGIAITVIAILWIRRQRKREEDPFFNSTHPSGFEPVTKAYDLYPKRPSIASSVSYQNVPFYNKPSFASSIEPVNVNRARINPLNMNTANSEETYADNNRPLPSIPEQARKPSPPFQQPPFRSPGGTTYRPALAHPTFRPIVSPVENGVPIRAFADFSYHIPPPLAVPVPIPVKKNEENKDINDNLEPALLESKESLGTLNREFSSRSSKLYVVNQDPEVSSISSKSQTSDNEVAKIITNMANESPKVTPIDYESSIANHMKPSLESLHSLVNIQPLPVEPTPLRSSQTPSLISAFSFGDLKQTPNEPEPVLPEQQEPVLASSALPGDQEENRVFSTAERKKSVTFASKHESIPPVPPLKDEQLVQADQGRQN